MVTPRSETGTGSYGEQKRDPGQLIESLKQELARVSGQVQEYLKDQAQGISDKVQKQTTEARETVHEQIREKPLAAVGIAAGLGFAVGLIMLRRRHLPRESWARNAWARNSDLRNWAPREVSRRDLHRVTDAIRDGFDRARSQAGDPAILDRLSNAISSLLSSSGAASMALAGTRAARQLVDRLASGR
jgi:ElaB/YqjD/DUF883 family membrane-anchored ribosome-binding protein